MNKLKTSAEIIERIEYIRNYLRLNKSRFSAEIGLKPQTYNNFIGSQGSKPSVELILGTVNRFGANPNWILNGKGPVFQEWTPEQEQRLRPGLDMDGWAAQLSEPAAAGDRSPAQPQSDISHRLASVEEKVREAERRLDAIEVTRFPLLRELRILLMRLVEQDPAQADEIGQEMVNRLRGVVDESR